MLRKSFPLPTDARLIYLARHGHSLSNRIIEKDNLRKEHKRVLHYNFPHTDEKAPLTREGKRQARELGDKIAAFHPEDDPIDRILVSPFERTQQSMFEINKSLTYDPEIITDPQLAERSRGLLYGFSDRGLAHYFPEFWAQWISPETGLDLEWPGGTSCRTFIELMRSFVTDKLIHLPGVTFVMTHSFAIVCMETVLEDLPSEEAHTRYRNLRIPNCGLSAFLQLPNGKFERLDLNRLSLGGS